jgi:hypothetical protein
LPAPTDHDAHDVRGFAPWRHEVDERDGAVGSLEIRLEDKGVVAVTPGAPHLRIGRPNPPPTVIGRSDVRKARRDFG